MSIFEKKLDELQRASDTIGERFSAVGQTEPKKVKVPITIIIISAIVEGYALLWIVGPLFVK